MNRRLLTAFAIPLLSLCTIYGQTEQNNAGKKPLVIERIISNVNFDGVRDEDFWNDSEPMPMDCV